MLLGPIGYILSLEYGIASFTKREIDTLTKKGFEITLCATKTGHGLYKPDNPVIWLKALLIFSGNLYYLFRRPLRYISAMALALRTSSYREFASGAGFARALERNGTRLVHSTFGDRKFFIAYYCNWFTGIPYTVMIHSHELVFYLNKEMFRLAMDSCSWVFTVCDWNKTILLASYPDYVDKISVSRLYVDPSQFMQDDRVKILTVGKLYEYKGYDVLVNAADMLRNDEVVFWIVGEGPLDVRTMVDQRNLKEKVILLGEVNEEILRILYQCCDAFCLPSRTASNGQTEGLPVSLMEAMSFSKPVISTKHAGIPELVPFRLVDENDSHELARAIRDLASDRSEWLKEGARNRSIIVRDYTPENARALESKFLELIGGSTSP